MLYRCDFDVRIIQKFATTYSRTPYFYRMDLFLGHLQFCVTDEQVMGEDEAMLFIEDYWAQFTLQVFLFNCVRRSQC